MNIDLTTTIGNLKLRSPVIVGSCPMTTDEMQRISMISNGVGGIVLPSYQVCQGSSPDDYLEQIESITSQDGIPAFASVRTSIENKDWYPLVKRLESAGAAAIEISLLGIDSSCDPKTSEDEIVDVAKHASSSVNIPLLLKLTPQFTNVTHLAERLQPYIQGLIMFGRAPVIDIELDSLSLSKRWGLTQSGGVINTLEPMMRARASQPNMPLIACGGIGTSEDLIKAIVAGANAVMVTSAIYRNGIASLGTMKNGLTKFMSDRGLENLEQLQSLCPSLPELGVDQAPVDFSGNPSDLPAMNQPEANQQNPNQIKCDRYGHPVE